MAHRCQATIGVHDGIARPYGLEQIPRERLMSGEVAPRPDKVVQKAGAAFSRRFPVYLCESHAYLADPGDGEQG